MLVVIVSHAMLPNARYYCKKLRTARDFLQFGGASSRSVRGPHWTSSDRFNISCASLQIWELYLNRQNGVQELWDRYVLTIHCRLSICSLPRYQPLQPKMPTVINNTKTKSASDIIGATNKGPTSGLAKKKPTDEKKSKVSKGMKEQDDDCCSV